MLPIIIGELEGSKKSARIKKSQEKQNRMKKTKIRIEKTHEKKVKNISETNFRKRLTLILFLFHCLQTILQKKGI